MCLPIFLVLRVFLVLHVFCLFVCVVWLCVSEWLCVFTIVEYVSVCQISFCFGKLSAFIFSPQVRLQLTFRQCFTVYFMMCSSSPVSFQSICIIVSLFRIRQCPHFQLYIALVLCVAILFKRIQKIQFKAYRALKIKIYKNVVYFLNISLSGLETPVYDDCSAC